MPARQILFNAEAHAKIAKGVETIATAVGKTMGPKGRAVAIDMHDFQPVFSVDGVTVANHVELSDPFEKLGADAVRTASRKTNDVAGDGTTTAAVLAHAIYTEGRKRIANGANPTDVKAEIEADTKTVVEALRAMAVPVDSLEKLQQVATISAKDAELGKTVADLITEVGPDGLITVEQSPTFGVETEITRGFKLDTGFVAPWMVTNPQKMNTELADCPVLVTDQNVDGDIMHLMDKLAKKGTKRLLIVADGFTNDALALMYANGSQGKFVTVGVRASGLGDHRKKENLRDLASATGAVLISEETGNTVKEATPEMCGTARQITVTAEDTLIVGGAGKQEDIDTRVGVIKKELETEKSEYNVTKLKERLSRLTGSAGVLKVGGTNDQEVKEKKYRVEDAVNAVRSAQAEGIVVGGGMSLVRATNSEHSSLEHSVIRAACFEPLRRIAENAGKTPEVILEKCLSLPEGEGWNAKTDTYEDLMAAGVIDPLKVTRTALENAASVAGLLLVTDVLIVDEPEKK